MPNESNREAVKQLVAKALESASPASVFSALPEVTLKTEGGQLLEISTPRGESSPIARLVSGGKTIDATPSGTFVLADRQTLRIEKGRIVDGRPNPGDARMFMTFALMPADRERSGQ